MVELILCLTISVSFVASNLGYFKLAYIPINSDNNGKIIEEINSRIILVNLNLNFIKMIKSPISIHGSIITKAANTLYMIISIGLIGKLFNILIDLDSKDIIELVIDVINDVNVIIPNVTIGKILYIKSIFIFVPVFVFITVFINVSNLYDNNIQAIINKTNPNPAFVINTGVEKNLFSSFFINEIVFEFVFII